MTTDTLHEWESERFFAFVQHGELVIHDQTGELGVFSVELNDLKGRNITQREFQSCVDYADLNEACRFFWRMSNYNTTKGIDR